MPYFRVSVQCSAVQCSAVQYCQIPLDIELKQDDYTVCCIHSVVQCSCSQCRSIFSRLLFHAFLHTNVFVIRKLYQENMCRYILVELVRMFILCYYGHFPFIFNLQRIFRRLQVKILPTPENVKHHTTSQKRPIFLAIQHGPPLAQNSVGRSCSEHQEIRSLVPGCGPISQTNKFQNNCEHFKDSNKTIQILVLIIGIYCKVLYLGN